ncbi:XRE family transcriptional regulator, partial [Candidatus Bipolaricaulota bacterium]|nr:XRE family transcriptional regulator [Candidatus Bipolaricaulota bacterium]
MVGERIKQARFLRRMSQRDLAAKVGVSATAISKYEKGLITPSSRILLKLARALDVRVEFFLRPALVKTIEPAFRKRQAFPRKEEKALLAHIRDWIERYLGVELILSGRPKVFEYPQGFPRPIRTWGQVEQAALDLREAWELGIDPIENLTQLLEDRGIKVGALSSEEAFDACTFVVTAEGEIPVIVVKRGLPGDRTRFNLAHELGHLLLRPDGNLSPEKVAHRFAGAFLAPKPAVLFELGEHRNVLSLYELHLLKHKYGLSMQAWIFRARDLGIISESLFRSLNKDFRARGWHREEPGDPYPPEHPVRFERLVVQALNEELISKKRAEELLGRSFEDFAKEVAREHGGLTVALCD